MTGLRAALADPRDTAGHDQAVVLEGVVKRFGRTVAVANMSLEIAKGEFVALIGPSGCGKTTTLRMIGGFEAPSEGRVFIAGELVNGVPPYQRNTATVWQQFALFPHLDVVKNVEFGLRMDGVGKQERRRRALAILDKVGLGGMAERDISELSGGQRQRVGLARALVVDPAVLLLDEPLGSLDANLRVAMQSQLKALQRELGLTFVYVTHNQSEALAMADRMAVMNDGRIEQIGTPREVFTAPRTRFVATFVGTNNIVTGTIGGVDGDGVRVQSPSGELKVRNRVATARDVGREVVMVVRADAVSIHGQCTSCDNVVDVVLRGEEYVGAAVTLTVELPGGELFKVARADRAEGLTHTLNERFAVCWSSADALLLPWDEHQTV